MSSKNDLDEVAMKKEKFDLCIDMLKGYYTGLESRVEKTSVLLVAILGWIVTSGAVRQTIKEDDLTFFVAIGVLFMFMIMSWFNVSHLLKRFRQVQAEAEKIDYVDNKYFTRYRMPNSIKGIPIFFIYMTPLIVLYGLIFILLLRFKFTL